MRQNPGKRSDLASLRKDLDKKDLNHDPEPPFEGGTVVGRAWHILEYRPDEDRTYYLGTTRNKIEDPNLAYLDEREFDLWLGGVDVTCELEK